MWFPTLIKNAEQQLLPSIYLARITALSFNYNLCCYNLFILWLLLSQIYQLNEYTTVHENPLTFQKVTN